MEIVQLLSLSLSFSFSFSKYVIYSTSHVSSEIMRTVMQYQCMHYFLKNKCVCHTQEEGIMLLKFIVLKRVLKVQLLTVVHFGALFCLKWTSAYAQQNSTHKVKTTVAQ